jgi:hypothetical protein
MPRFMERTPVPTSALFWEIVAGSNADGQAAAGSFLERDAVVVEYVSAVSRPPREGLGGCRDKQSSAGDADAAPKVSGDELGGLVGAVGSESPP